MVKYRKHDSTNLCLYFQKKKNLKEIYNRLYLNIGILSWNEAIFHLFKTFW